jgi:adenylate cyclase
LRSQTAPTQQIERQLVAILSADIAGYSRLMGADEEGTLARLRTCRRGLIEPCIARHHGRTVKTTGDGLLVEFASPVEAVRCAVEWQRAMLESNADLAAEKRLEFRIGINLGDVIVADKDLYGDAVNIAARLEALADPGGICISRTVRDQIRDRLALPFEDGGEQSVKNIARPVRAYALSAEAIASLQSREDLPARRLVRPFFARHHMVAGALAGVLIIAGGSWWLWPDRQVGPLPQPESAAAPASTPSATAAPQARAISAPRFSIVVLPFANLSKDPDQDYFADGVTEDLTTDLSQIAGMFVIARNTAFTYKGKAVDARQIGRDLNVRYVLEGSIRRSGNEVRVNAQLVDAETGAHLWAERFDRETGDLFKLQNEITGQIAVALGTQLLISEAGRPSERPDVQDYILRARAASTRLNSRENFRDQIGLYERALALDPLSAGAMAGLARTLANRLLDYMSDTRAEDIQRADELATRALTLSPHSAWAHYAKAQILRAQDRCEDAIIEYEQVIAINRNQPFAYSHLGWCKLQTGGTVDEATRFIEQAIRLSPRDPFIFLWHTMLGLLDLYRSRPDDAIVWLEKARVANPGVSYVRGNLAAAYALKGMTERAAAELAEARKLSDVYSSLARLKKVHPFHNPKVQALAEPTLFAGLRLAGMPEE